MTFPALICLPLATLQGKRDLNPQPSVLETDALPIELLPSGALHQLLSYTHDPLAGRTKTMVRGHQTRESTEDYDGSRTASGHSGPSRGGLERSTSDDGTDAIGH
jgi:hypothetical protein